MRTPRTVSRIPTLKKLGLAALLLVAATSAQACEIWRDEHLGIWRGNCDLSIDFKGKYTVSENFVGAHSTHTLKMPDLHIFKFKFYNQTATQLRIEADIENLGDLNVSASAFVTTVDVGNPLTGAQVGTTTTLGPVSVPAIPAGNTVRILVGYFTVPNNLQDWDLTLFGTIDPATPAAPVRGVVIESDETNNTLPHVCRHFGPVPDASLQVCN